MFLKSTVIAALAVSTLSSPALADFNIGGWIGVEYDFESYGSAKTSIITDTLLSYETGGNVFGVGFSGEFVSDDTRVGDLYFLYSSALNPGGRITLTYGEFYGAGNLMPEDYFGVDDSTGRSENTFRVDYSNNGHHFAASVVTDDTEDFELGYRGEFGAVSSSVAAWNLTIAYENDPQDLSILLGHDRGNWGYDILSVLDLDDAGTADHVAFTLFYDVTPDLGLAWNVSWAYNTSELQSWGVLATYALSDSVRAKAEYVNDTADGDYSYEFGLIYDFGKTQPHHSERISYKEYYSRLR
ncbi:MAG: hypothetical protein V3U96_02265 [Paracoccaceae bacterium]